MKITETKQLQFFIIYNLIQTKDVGGQGYSGSQGYGNNRGSYGGGPYGPHSSGYGGEPYGGGHNYRNMNYDGNYGNHGEHNSYGGGYENSNNYQGSPNSYNTENGPFYFNNKHHFYDCKFILLTKLKIKIKKVIFSSLLLGPRFIFVSSHKIK